MMEFDFQMDTNMDTSFIATLNGVHFIVDI